MSQGSQVSRYATVLRDNGVVSIENYYDDEKCDEIRASINAILGSDSLEEADSESSYRELVNAGKPLVDRRGGGTDEGMLDVFNVHLKVDQVNEFRNDEFILDIVNSATEEPYTPQNVNTYVNRSVTNTRGYHADTYSGKFKSFIYLTDVPDKSFGPFSYVRGSHRKGAVEQRLNKVINKLRGNNSTDALRYDPEERVDFVAPRGTLIIANQAGYHRGLPQEEGRERMLITTSYKPK